MIIDRHFIHPNFTLQTHNSLDDREKLIELINIWKCILLNKFKLQPGDKIALVQFFMDIHYFAIFIAGAELGISFIIVDAPTSEAQVQNVRMKILTPIKLSLICNHIKKRKFVVQMLNDYTERTEVIEDFQKFADEVGATDELANLILAKDTDVLVYSTTSGTTNIPKPIPYTHEFLYELSKRNATFLGYAEDDVVLHLRNMHHAASLNCSFLPSLTACANHVFLLAGLHDDDPTLVLANYLNDYNITKVFIPYPENFTYFINDCVKRNIKLNPNLTIMNVGFYLDVSIIDKVKQLGINQIIGIFGNNETGGPILLNKVRTDTRPELFQFGFVGEASSDDFFTVDVNDDGNLLVTNSILDPVVFEDKFVKIDGYYYHRGRSNFYRINEIDIDINILQALIKEASGCNDFSVVIDSALQKVYIAVWDDSTIDEKEIQNLIYDRIGKVNISGIQKLDKNTFMYGIKLDFPALRNYFFNQK
jgi:acyl-coenzyme A synthetase/AMP-(fatty) acid ligase